LSIIMLHHKVLLHLS